MFGFGSEGIDQAEFNAFLAASDLRTLLGIPVGSAAANVISAEIDFVAAAATYVLIPPTAGYQLATGPATIITITAKDGTVLTAPTLQLGTNAAINDCNASQTPAGFTTQAVNTRLSLVAPTPINSNLDLTTNGLRMQITVPATLGTATELKGRVFFIPLAIFTNPYVP